MSRKQEGKEKAWPKTQNKATTYPLLSIPFLIIVFIIILTMLLTSPLLNLSTSLKLPHPSSFLNASNPIKHLLPKTPITPQTPSSLTIHAMKKLQGRVVKDANDKTVAVEVVRLAPHPKYKRRVRIKKRYQAHDPDNVFKVGDFVQLEKIRPISKTKTFIAVPVAARNAPKAVEEVPKELLELPLQSQEQSPL